MIHVDSANIVVVMFVDHVNKVHGLLVEPKQAEPFFEINMFIFNFFNQGRKEQFHLLLEIEEFGDFGVRVLAYDVFKLTPHHLLTLFMEECALTFAGQPVLANESRFSAICVDADHLAGIAINTLWTAF